MSDEKKSEQSLQLKQEHIDRATVTKHWELEFKAKFQKLENALVVARTIAGNTSNLKRRAVAADKYIEQLRKSVDKGDAVVMHRFLTRLSKEMYQIRAGLTDTTGQCRELKKYLHQDVDLESYWQDAKKEDLD
jgi:hypothetical protein